MRRTTGVEGARVARQDVGDRESMSNGDHEGEEERVDTQKWGRTRSEGSVDI